MSDENKSNTICFPEFLNAISKFTKDPIDEKIKTIFYLYDIDQNNYIEKEEFIKMLYNYPQEYIEDLTKIFNEYIPKNFLYHSNLYKNNFKNSQVLHKNESTKCLNFDFKESELLSENFSVIFNEIFINKKVKRLFSTSFNTKIKLLAIIIFKRYADEENGKLNLTGFKNWLKLHNKFIDSFENCFRTRIWKNIIVDGKEILGFHKLVPDLKGTILIQNFNSSRKKKTFIQVFGFFMLFFKNIKSINPFRVILLKGLFVEFKDLKNKIILNHKNKIYKGIKLKIKENDEYLIWKDYINFQAKDKFFSLYMILEKIGRGKFSSVYKVHSKKDGNYYAMKIIKKKDLSPTELSVLQKESKIMEILNHRNVIKFYEASENTENYIYILELVKGIDLFEYVLENFPLEENKVSLIMKQLFNAINYIHEAGIIHRDLKPENVMIELDSRKIVKKVKIIDFGLSCYIDDLKDLDNIIRCGTINYSAPEMINKEMVYNEKIDIYSLGVIMYFLLKGSLPFSDIKSEVIKENVLNKELNLDKDLNGIYISDQAKDLLSKLLEKDQKKRICLKKAKSHPWIRYNKLLGKQNVKN